MSGVEIIVPIVLFCGKLFSQFGISLLDTNNDAEAFVMLESNVADNINDAYLFHGKLMRYPGKEEQLKERAMVAIRKTERAMHKSHHRLKREGIRKKLKFVISDRRAARSLLRPLQSAQPSLSRRIDWMRSALEALTNSRDEEGELASSMAPGVMLEIEGSLAMDEGAGNYF
ncbi:hypothetical protein B0J15DRAFT_575808 [Fusarium solani]|uniref:Uncharacterized protein n=1 Tax=Fusarium solani TaxID=169388 RepID=A0A9P9R948_FUSSL|nr:uncharacterized protein B0J15DRAFT_575808 [Fusarium solani]KAH7270921.1 hypothetical protein B0J15DRAFT_575808 [Fusarium solani]